MEIDDKELFSSSMSDEPIAEAATEAPAEPAAEEAPQQDGQPRDEHGRFAPKAPTEAAAPTEPQPPPQAETAKEEGGSIPPWRLREMREERDELNRRYLDTQRQLDMMRQQQPKPEAKPAPDLYENPDGFVDHRLQQSLSPIEQRLQAAEARLQAQLEANSRRDAFREHGQDTVRQAYEWLAVGIQNRDADTIYAYNRVMQSDHPYDAAVQAFKRASVVQQVQQIGDLDKWAVQRAQELATRQPQQGQKPTSQPQGSVIKLPPSLRDTPSARASDEDDNDTSDAAMFRHALR